MYVLEDVTLGPNSMTFVKIQKVRRNGEILVEPVADAMCQAVPAVYRDTDKIAILNLGEEPKMMKKGLQVANYTKVWDTQRSKEDKTCKTCKGE